MNPASDKEILDLICEALERDSGSLSLDRSIRDVPEWTSIGWLAIISLLDERFNIALGSKDIRGFQRVSDVVEFVRSKNGAQA